MCMCSLPLKNCPGNEKFPGETKLIIAVALRADRIGHQCFHAYVYTDFLKEPSCKNAGFDF